MLWKFFEEFYQRRVGFRILRLFAQLIRQHQIRRSSGSGIAVAINYFLVLRRRFGRAE